MRDDDSIRYNGECVTLHERNITLGPFITDNCFLIENSIKNTKLQGFKTVECIVFRQDDKPHLIFIEAKSSTLENNELRFDKLINNLSQKFIDSLNISFTLNTNLNKIEIHVPSNFSSFFTQNNKIIFVIIFSGNINDSSGIKEVVTRRLKKQSSLLRSLIDIEVQVISKEIAINNKLAISE